VAKHKDCCPARHKMLHDASQVRGIAYGPQAMWSLEQPLVYHDPTREDYLRRLLPAQLV